MGGGGTLPSQNSKFQDLPKFQFLGEEDTLPSQNSKFQDLPKFQFLGGGVLCQVKTQSSKICLIFNFGGGEGVGGVGVGGGGVGTLPSQNSKFQDLPKFQFSGGGGTLPSQNSKFQDLPKFQFWGWGVLCQVKTQSSKICLNFNFHGGGGYSTVLRVGHSQNFEPKFTVQPETCLCITDSLSHTTYVETNKYL